MDKDLGRSLLPGFDLLDPPEGLPGGIRLRARHDGAGLEVDLEVIGEGSVAGGEDVTEHVRTVAEGVGALTHPALAGLLFAGPVGDGRWVLMTERPSARTLATELRQLGPEPLPLPRALTLLARVADGLAGAHGAGVTHRDLRPEQVAFGPDKPDGEVVLLHGAGRVALLEAAGLLPGGDAALVQPAWAAPEQLDGAPGAEPADLYSLGVLAYRLCVGRLPFECASKELYRVAHRKSAPPPPAERRPRYVAPLPEVVDQLILGCLEKAPGDRPRAQELARELSEMALGVTREALEQRRAAGPLAPWKRIRVKAVETARYVQYVRLGNVALAEALAALGPHDAAQQERDRQAEEAEEAWDAVYGERREQEHRLRGAVLKLALEHGRLVARGAGDQPGTVDLTHQIDELLRSIAGSHADGAAALQSATTELTRARLAAEDWARQEPNRVLNLVGAVRERRDAAGDPSLHERIDALVELVSQTRGVSVRTLPGH